MTFVEPPEKRAQASKSSVIIATRCVFLQKIQAGWETGQEKTVTALAYLHWEISRETRSVMAVSYFSVELLSQPASTQLFKGTLVQI